MNNKKPIGIILLIIFLAWGILNIASRIFLRADSTDIKILDHYNIAYIGYILAFLLLILNIASLYFILTRKKWGIRIIYAFLILSVFFTSFVLIMSLLNFEISKDAYLQSRISRGLNVESIDTIMNPATAITMHLAYTLFYLFLGFYVHKKRSYFSC